VFTPMLALAVYLVLHQVLWGGMRGGQRWLLAALSAVMIVNVFLTRGRAGQLAFFVLMAVLCVQHFRKNLLRAILIPLVSLPLVFVVAYQVSPVFQQRMDQIQQDIETFDQRPDVSSVGLRLHYWKIAWQIIKEEPWLGAGTGDFAPRYAQINQQLSPGSLSRTTRITSIFLSPRNWNSGAASPCWACFSSFSTKPGSDRMNGSGSTVPSWSFS
jgi:O-antigen ligase